MTTSLFPTAEPYEDESPPPGTAIPWRRLDQPGPDTATLLRRDGAGCRTLDDTACPVDGCVDLDLSFTPAPNLLAESRWSSKG